MFGLLRRSLSKMLVTDLAVHIEEVVRGPVFIIERAPNLVFVVYRDGIQDAQVTNSLLHIGKIFFERKLRSVYAHDNQSALPVLLSPGSQIRDRAEAIDAGIRPEVDQHDFPTQLLDPQR